ncbi:MAG: 50S ribosomal protein L10 [Clostridia bacterium]|nr:50S ribosomal protein L10 [Clostridia bacterium]
MPSAKILEQKKLVVAALADKLSKATAGVFVDYCGITVEEDTKLRAEMRKAGVEYTVVKNTLTRLAAKEAGLEGLDEILNGTTALAVSYDDAVAPAKILDAYASKHDNFKIKMGFVEGKVISAAEVKNLAMLPSREVLIAQVLGTMNAPITGLVTVLNGNIRGLAVALKAIAEQKGAQ